MKITHLIFQTKAESPIHKPEIGHKMFHQKLKSWKAKRDTAKFRNMSTTDLGLLITAQIKENTFAP